MQKVIALMSSNQTREPRAGSLSGSNAQMVLYNLIGSRSADTRPGVPRRWGLLRPH